MSRNLNSYIVGFAHDSHFVELERLLETSQELFNSGSNDEHHLIARHFAVNEVVKNVLHLSFLQDLRRRLFFARKMLCNSVERKDELGQKASQHSDHRLAFVVSTQLTKLLIQDCFFGFTLGHKVGINLLPELL